MSKGNTRTAKGIVPSKRPEREGAQSRTDLQSRCVCKVCFGTLRVVVSAVTNCTIRGTHRQSSTVEETA